MYVYIYTYVQRSSASSSGNGGGGGGDPPVSWFLNLAHLQPGGVRAAGDVKLTVNRDITHAHIDTYIHTHTHIHTGGGRCEADGQPRHCHAAGIYPYIYECISVYICTNVYVCMYMYIDIYTYTYTYTSTYI